MAISFVLLLVLCIGITPLSALAVVSTANSSVNNLTPVTKTAGQPINFQATVKDAAYSIIINNLLPADFTYNLGGGTNLNVNTAVYNATTGFYDISATPAAVVNNVYMTVYAQGVAIGGFSGVTIGAGGGGGGTPAPTIMGLTAVEGLPVETGLGPGDQLIIEIQSTNIANGTTYADKAAVDAVIDWKGKSFGTSYNGLWRASAIQQQAPVPGMPAPMQQQLVINCTDPTGATFVPGDTIQLKAAANIKSPDGSSAASTATSPPCVNTFNPTATDDGKSFLTFDLKMPIPAGATVPPPLCSGIIKADGSPRTITVIAPAGSPKSGLVAIYNVSAGATVLKGGTQWASNSADAAKSLDFSAGPITFTVQATDGTSNTYVVSLASGSSQPGGTTGPAGIDPSTMTASQKVDFASASFSIPMLAASNWSAPVGVRIPLGSGLGGDWPVITWSVKTDSESLVTLENRNPAVDATVPDVFTKIAIPANSIGQTATLVARIATPDGSYYKDKEFSFIITALPVGVSSAIISANQAMGAIINNATTATQVQTAMQNAFDSLNAQFLAADTVGVKMNLINNQIQSTFYNLASKAASDATNFKPELIAQTQTMLNTIKTNTFTQIGRGFIPSATDLTAGKEMINNLIDQTIIAGNMAQNDITANTALKNSLASTIMKVIDSAGTFRPAVTTVSDLSSQLTAVNTNFDAFNSKLNTVGGAAVLPVERRINLFVPSSSNVITLDQAAINQVIAQASNNVKLAIAKEVTVGAVTVPVAAKIPAAFLQNMSNQIGTSLTVDIVPQTTITVPATYPNASSVFSFTMTGASGTVSDFTYAQVPVTVEMPYSGSGTNLIPYYRNASGIWTPVTTAGGGNAAVTVTEDRTVTFDTTHFTDFMVAEAVATSSGSSSGGGSSSTTTTTTTPSVTATLGTPVSVTASSGATISGSGVEIAIPAGAVNADIKVTISKVADTAGLSVPSTSQLVSDVLEIVKDKSGDFSKAVTISLNFDKSKVDTSKVDVAVCFFDESKKTWVKLDNIKIDTSTGKVSGDVTHFTKFAVLTFPKTAAVTTPATTPAVTVSTGLKDITGHWAEANIQNLVSKGVIKGYPDGTFKPNNAITRAEFAVILVKSVGAVPQAGKVFNDTAGHWAKDYISTAVAMGIVSGYSTTRFAPDEQISREQMAQMVANAAKLAKSSAKLPFKDAANIAAWAKDAVASIQAVKIMSGYPDNTFKPQAKATRAEAVTVIVKIMN